MTIPDGSERQKLREQEQELMTDELMSRSEVAYKYKIRTDDFIGAFIFTDAKGQMALLRWRAKRADRSHTAVGGRRAMGRGG